MTSRPPATTPAAWQRRSTRAEWLGFAAWVAGLCGVCAAFQAMTQETIWSFVLDAPAQAADIGARMLPPDWGFLAELWLPLWETFNIGVSSFSVQ